jgi:hypothetical protein
MSKGYFTIAQGEKYQRMAYALALSLKISQPSELSKLSIGVTTEELQTVNPKYKEVFDNVIEIPWDDHAKNSTWKLENEWKAIHMTPYDETVKLDADMIFPTDISSWWKVLELSEGVFATDAMTFRGQKITSDICRRTFTANNLPNVYTAFFYFKKTPANFELFKLAEDIFYNWETYFFNFLEPERRPAFVSTDVVFALAAKILDYTSLNRTPYLDTPTFVHMKSRLQGFPDDFFMNEDWTKMAPYYFTKDCELIIENHRQILPFHYYVKEFMTDEMITKMEKKLGI